MIQMYLFCWHSFTYNRTVKCLFSRRAVVNIAASKCKQMSSNQSGIISDTCFNHMWQYQSNVLNWREDDSFKYWCWQKCDDVRWQSQIHGRNNCRSCWIYLFLLVRTNELSQTEKRFAVLQIRQNLNKSIYFVAFFSYSKL